MSNKFDIAILGGGPAGYVAAERAGAKGMRVILFDKRALGGVCLNEGCIPTKTLLNSAKVLENAKEASKYGVQLEGSIMADFGKIMKRKDKVVRKLVAGVKAKMKHAKAEVVMAEAVVKEKRGDVITLVADGNEYQATRLLVCSGSEAAVPPIPGLDSSNVLTNREILQLKTLPKSLVIIGGGVIGSEFADFFNAMGTKVTVIEMLPEILTGVDEDIAAFVRKEFTQRGIDYHLSAKVTELKGKEVFFEKDGELQSITGDEVLLSVGRRPNVAGVGLENIGVEFTPKGIKIDENCRTNIPNVYAAGDVTGFSLLAHTASREAEVAVNHMLGRKDVMRYQAIPGVVYTHPEIAGVGLTESAAKAKGIEVETRQLPMAYAGRFLAENEGKDGFCKVIVGKKYKEILGIHMVGGACSEMVWGACALIEAQFRVQDVEEVVFPHPTVSEIIKETIFQF
ncbi:dihydrolipoyl dehydrogenase [Sunxiuqinia elliptica]|uniref:Dihydrolipoyl dehydrogenase n=1 Tax=Sunxiuqinia elliptica TaxID=655355 RepID=A0A4R6HAM7_9BACT|nr:dihydrolipoyl dehydrogenase [Sunxiuqinia elliptica]TDO04751.1 dihydrolipoamide dehydrogenase [Sunxiuqinia elliptica]TDO64298.1 dihydrolipoamide dehydrogenase [Sunxiuqinia elliptica]